jgi:hypothetical protein
VDVTVAVKRLARGRYLTTDGRFLIESDCPSVGESYDLQGNMIASEDERASEWFVYDTSSRAVQRGDYGPPDALGDGFGTLRDAKRWVGTK